MFSDTGHEKVWILNVSGKSVPGIRIVTVLDAVKMTYFEEKSIIDESGVFSGVDIHKVQTAASTIILGMGN